MTVLLDTNVFLFIARDGSLPKAVQRIVENHSTEILVSIITYWEIAILNNESFGKRKRIEMPFRRVEQAVEAMSARLLPITINHTGILHRLPMFHRDPFDRMIIAQALEERCPVLSADQRFELYKGQGLKVIWN
ncbi:MAG: type II toxin-antitoxin system VapC family toxin [Acidobacteriaceae bacterium]|nr:type II toxin-antitoxin system VapC family toxin [Acidobacteriaceae bacterium]